MEAVPARYFVNTSFVATIVTQQVRFRLDGRSASLRGISASRILARELHNDPEAVTIPTFDLGDLVEESSLTMPSDLELTINDSDASLELDRLWFPENAAVKITSNGEKATMEIEFIEPSDTGKVESRLVWRGDVTLSDGTQSATGIGSRIWRAEKPSLTIDKAQINGLIPTPIRVSAIEFDRVVSGDQYQSHASAILAGDIQFDIGGYPGRQMAIREGEMLSLRGLDAQIVNFSLAEKGLRFLLIGTADVANLGFSDRRRNIQPSLFDAIRAWESLTIIISALFTLLLALIGAFMSNSPDNGDKKK